jgi:hypothetical protein
MSEWSERTGASLSPLCLAFAAKLSGVGLGLAGRMEPRDGRHPLGAFRINGAASAFAESGSRRMLETGGVVGSRRHHVRQIESYKATRTHSKATRAACQSTKLLGQAQCRGSQRGASAGCSEYLEAESRERRAAGLKAMRRPRSRPRRHRSRHGSLG